MNRRRIPKNRNVPVKSQESNFVKTSDLMFSEVLILHYKGDFPLDSHLPHSYNGCNNLTGNREETFYVVAILVALRTTEVVTTFGAPKVQIWNRRTQMKLSGKRTLCPTNSGKFLRGKLREGYRRCNASLVEYKGIETKDANLSGQITEARDLFRAPFAFTWYRLNN